MMKHTLFASRFGSSSAGFKVPTDSCDDDAENVVPVFTAGNLVEMVATLSANVSWYMRAVALVLDNKDSYASSVILVESSSAEWPNLEMARNATR
jgi:hypothetical protein